MSVSLSSSQIGQGNAVEPASSPRYDVFLFTSVVSQWISESDENHREWNGGHGNSSQRRSERRGEKNLAENQHQRKGVLCFASHE